MPDFSKSRKRIKLKGLPQDFSEPTTSELSHKVNIIDYTFDESFEFIGGWDDTVDPLPTPSFGIISYNETYEFIGGWDDTVDTIPTPSFGIIGYNETYEASGGWDDTVDTIPTPSFASENFGEDFDSSWDGI